MSVLADEQARRGMPAQMSTNGESVVRTPKVGDPEPLVGLWKEYSEDLFSSNRPQRLLENGERIVRHGVLCVPRTQTVLDTDTWTVLGETWVVQRVGAAFGGWRELYLQLDDIESVSVGFNRRRNQ